MLHTAAADTIVMKWRCAAGSEAGLWQGPATVDFDEDAPGLEEWGARNGGAMGWVPFQFDEDAQEVQAAYIADEQNAWVSAAPLAELCPP